MMGRLLPNADRRHTPELTTPSEEYGLDCRISNSTHISNQYYSSWPCQAMTNRKSTQCRRVFEVDKG
ncbi:uncharacterized protein BCR38DRAFT_423958 [Pseudomassariella vexata]|uniref:Uncharacterized protein n=1 Tax=Pseudomassariella vexata TaxID=1141098 RepID=A0A1Y2EBH7_9PEZI|nr:uncharacterized protein BCR38DRAFT_423958 [Pseudomassariella vexata]ORY68654.1 hypothetical protein BCR38DRAFT_423958 [Pseudomassariella vexata]